MPSGYGRSRASSASFILVAEWERRRIRFFCLRQDFQIDDMNSASGSGSFHRKNTKHFVNPGGGGISSGECSPSRQNFSLFIVRQHSPRLQLLKLNNFAGKEAAVPGFCFCLACDWESSALVPQASPNN